MFTQLDYRLGVRRLLNGDGTIFRLLPYAVIGQLRSRHCKERWPALLPLAELRRRLAAHQHKALDMGSSLHRSRQCSLIGMETGAPHRMCCFAKRLAHPLRRVEWGMGKRSQHLHPLHTVRCDGG